MVQDHECSTRAVGDAIITHSESYVCAIVRRSVLSMINFPDDKNRDEEFYRMIHERSVSKVVWPAKCQHLDGLTAEAI